MEANSILQQQPTEAQPVAISLQPVAISLAYAPATVFVPSQHQSVLRVSKAEFLAMADYPEPLLVATGGNDPQIITGYKAGQFSGYWCIVATKESENVQV